MSFWLKAAEGLLEEVDRRAKKVVGEHLDNQSESQATTAEQDVSRSKQPKKSKKKEASKLSAIKSPAKLDQSNKETPLNVLSEWQDEEKTEQYEDSYSGPNTYNKMQLQNSGSSNDDYSPRVYKEKSSPIDKIDKNGEVTYLSVAEVENSDPVNIVDRVNNNINPDKEEATVGVDLPSSSSDLQSKVFDKQTDSAVHLDKESVQCNVLAENGSVTVELLSAKEPLIETPIKNVHSHAHSPETEENREIPVKKNSSASLSPETPSLKEQPTEKPGATRVEDQLTEAQGLLKSATSAGQSKEARLARVCAGLSSRLQEYRKENSQLEELLSNEREERKILESQLAEFKEEMSLARSASRSAEAEMAHALALKNKEIESLMSTIDSLKKRAAVSEEKLETLQSNTEALLKNRELTETRMIQALREELAASERRAEEERIAHNASRMAAMERESDLKQQAAESSAALARAQRTIDERMQRVTDLEHKYSILEIECATLNQELQEMETRIRRDQKKVSEEANISSQLIAWQEEVERARHAQREAEDKLSTMKAENQKLRVEVTGMKKDAEQYSREAQLELEKRYRDLTELLYLKQTQLEAMASEKAAAKFQLEKEGKRLRELQAEADKSRTSRRLSMPWDEEEGEPKPFESLPLQHRQMVGSSIRKAAKILDSGTVRAARFLWRHPVARLIFLFYLVFVHLFLLYLLHRLQEQADSLLSSKEAMGILKVDLP